MLISSSTIDKDSGHIKSNGTLRSHHRAMMASMSKLSLSAQTGSDASKILTEANELLMMIRNFVNTCQDLNLPLIHTDPQWIIEEDKRRPSTATTAATTTTTTTRYSLQINLAENLETMGTCIQDSAETIIKCISSFNTADRSSLAALLFTHFRNLSNQSGLFLGYLDETDFSPVLGELEMKDLMIGKQALSDSLGLLFFKMQAITNEQQQDFNNSLRETEQAAASLFDPIELICASVLSLANKNRGRNNSNASFLSAGGDLLMSKPAATMNAMMDKESIIDEVEEEDELEEDDSFLGNSNHTSSIANGSLYTDDEFDEEEEEASENDEDDIDDIIDAMIDAPPKRRTRVSRTTSVMDTRHRSEIPTTNNVIPPPMQRSHTAPATKQTTSSNKLKKFFGDDAPLPPAALIAASANHSVNKSAAASVNERPKFLDHDYDVNDIVYNMEGNVKGGTLPALVERLTMHDYLDMNFINTFLLTYRSFCSTQELLDLLEARYNIQCPEGLTEEEAIMWEEKKLKLVRLRVFNVLKNWLELYYNEDDYILLDRLLEFTSSNIKVTLKFSNGQLESLIQRRKNRTVSMDNGGFKKMILTLPDPPEPILPRNRRRFKLLDIDTLEMARQLTIMDFKLYSAIKPIECLDKAWSQEDDNVAENIRASIEYCNQITSWVSDIILSQHDIKKRSILIKYWVQVAEVTVVIVKKKFFIYITNNFFFFFLNSLRNAEY
jgi:hypothetical protein